MQHAVGATAAVPLANKFPKLVRDSCLRRLSTMSSSTAIPYLEDEMVDFRAEQDFPTPAGKPD